MSPGPRLHRRRPRRESESGIAMLVVMLILVMMSAVGIFAAQSTAFEVRTSGHVRQAMQTHYVSETATLAAIEEFGQHPDAYRRYMIDRSLPYYVMGVDELATRTPSWQAVYPPDGYGNQLQPSFAVTLRDIFVSRRPVAGGAVAGGTSTDGPVNVFVAISTQGTMGLPGADPTYGRQAQSNERSVSHVTVLNVQP